MPGVQRLLDIADDVDQPANRFGPLLRCGAGIGKLGEVIGEAGKRRTVFDRPEPGSSRNDLQLIVPFGLIFRPAPNIVGPARQDLEQHALLLLWTEPLQERCKARVILMLPREREQLRQFGRMVLPEVDPGDCPGGLVAFFRPGHGRGACSRCQQRECREPRCKPAHFQRTRGPPNGSGGGGRRWPRGSWA